MPRPAITKRFIISVESSSIETCMASSTSSNQALRRVRVMPDFGNSIGYATTSWHVTSLLGGKRVLGGNDQTDLVAVNVDHLQPLLLDRQLRQSEIGDVFHHRFDHARAVGAIHQELDGGEQALILGEDFRQDVDAGGFIGGDHQFSARVSIELVDGVLGAPAQIQHLLGVLR